MKSNQLRSLRIQFRVSKQHALAKPASLIVNSADDATTMFNTAGMQPLVPYLMGKEHPVGDKLFNTQGCVRTVDIEEVGDINHLTFFEMMGNRSLNSYFKKEALTRSWEFLTSSDWMGLDPDMITVTVFEGNENAPLDTEAKQVWTDLGLASYRITPLDKHENRRGPAGATGPCGPDSEIFYRVGEGVPPVDSHPGNDEDNWLEIWNNVFMEYYKDDAGVYTKMERINVDTGMGFERILMVRQGDEKKRANPDFVVGSLSVYDIDTFQSFFESLSKYSSQSYAETISAKNDLNNKLIKSFRISADHMRTALFLVDEGLAPSNEGRGYVLRRIVRRGYYHLMKLCAEQQDMYDKTLFAKIIQDLLVGFADFYPHLKTGMESTIKTILGEMNQFQQTIRKGGEKLEQLLESYQGKQTFSGSDAFLLYDTYGFPVELTQEILDNHDLLLDKKGFDAAQQKAKELSRAGASAKFAKGINWADYIEGIPETKFVGYDVLETSSAVLLKDFQIGDERYLIFDVTPFYAESGGQKGDSGEVELDSGEVVKIVDVIKYGGVWLHKVG